MFRDYLELMLRDLGINFTNLDTFSWFSLLDTDYPVERKREGERENYVRLYNEL